jgi:hypothetical protein
MSQGPVPQKMVLGSRAPEGERIVAGRWSGCVVYGVAPAMSGALEAAVRKAWQGWMRERCEASEEGVVGYDRAGGAAVVPAEESDVAAGVPSRQARGLRGSARVRSR